MAGSIPGVTSILPDTPTSTRALAPRGPTISAEPALWGSTRRVFPPKVSWTFVGMSGNGVSTSMRKRIVRRRVAGSLACCAAAPGSTVRGARAVYRHYYYHPVNRLQRVRLSGGVLVPPPLTVESLAASLVFCTFTSALSPIPQGVGGVFACVRTRSRQEGPECPRASGHPLHGSIRWPARIHVPLVPLV
jgi:hypothetical protein